MKTSVKVSRNTLGLPDVGQVFLHRDYTRTEEHNLPLTTAKMELQTSLSSIEYVFIERLTGSDTVYLYKNRSPESLGFTDFLVVADVSLSHITLRAGGDVTVRVVLGGS